MSEIAERALPLFQSPYNTNRMCIALLDVGLLLLNSFALHQYTASKIINIPETEHLLENLRDLNNQTQQVSDALIDQVEQDNEHVRAQVNITFQRRFHYTMARLEQNQDNLVKAIMEEETHRENYNSIATYLRAWDTVGNTIPYQETTTSDDITLLETTLLLENGTTVKHLSAQYQELQSSIHANVQYQLDYLYNLTGRPLDFLDHLQYTLQTPNLRGASIDVSLEAFRDNLITTLRNIRENFKNQYDFLTIHLAETQLAFEELAQTYRALYDLVVSLKTALQKINTGTLGISSVVIPDIDLDQFPPVEVYRPDVVALPDVDVLLEPLDELIRQLDADFDKLGDEIIASLQDALASNLQQIYHEFANALLLDDYNPPPIIFNGLLVSLQEALSLQAELNFNITRQVTLPSAPFTAEVPVITIPRVNPFADTSLSFTRPSVDLLSWRIPDLGQYALFWDEIVLWVVMCWSIVEPFVINVYRALRRLFEYFEGTAVPLPVVDLRTTKEKIDKKNRKKSRAQDILAVVFDPLLTFVITRVLPVIIFIGLVVVGTTYYKREHAPNCIHSNRGTSIGSELIGPIVHNRAVAGADGRAAELSAENHAYIQPECQNQYAESYDTYSEQIVKYETKREQAERFSARTALAQRTVHLNALCAQHAAACESSDSGLVCPLDQDGAPLPSPCSFRHYPTSLSALELHDPLQPCTDLPTGEVAQPDLASGELTPQESWCKVEWWFLSRAWQFAYVLGSYVILSVTFSLVISGIQVFHWRHFRPEEYHIHCTSTRSGKFTQPDYLDESAKSEAIEEWELSNRIFGVLKLLGGGILFVGWVAIVVVTSNTDTTPVWQ